MVERQQNWQPQQRVDIPHLRAIEAGGAGDFDVLVGQMVAGLNPFVVSGFDTIPPTAGTPATSVQVNVVNGRICHPLASESGTIFSVPAGRTVETLNVSNTRVTGSFTASATNYVGLDLLRSADDGTTDLLQILDSDTLLETPKKAPLARTLDYVLVISNQDFATTPNVAPLVKVVTDTNNNVVSVEDARNLMFRLGRGGGITQPLYSYPWAGGRAEVGNNTDFNAGDKVISSFKDWMDAAMTRIWEVGGGEHWYSAVADRNVQLVRNGVTLFTNGDYFEWTGTNLHWRELRFVFPNSTGSFNDVADQLTDNPGQTDLADGQCVYVDVDRTTNRTGGTALVAAKATTLTMGTPTTPGSRYIIAWRVGSNIYTRGNSYAVGTTFNPATTSVIGMVKLSVTPGAPGAPVVFNPGVNNNLIVAATAGNASGITTTGNGNGNGIDATGGATGAGIVGTGGATGGVGGGFTGKGNFAGITANGGNGGTSGWAINALGGNTNGGGIIVQGQGTAAGADVTGGSTGPALIAHAVAANNTPALIVQDSAGNNRFLVDHYGFPMATQRWELREIWLQPAVSVSSGSNVIVPNNARWTYKLGATAQLLGICDSAFPGPRLTFSLASGVANPGYLYTSMQVVNMAHSVSMVAVAEVQFRVANIQNAANTHYVGFSDQIDPTTITGGTGCAMWFELNNGNIVGKQYNANATPIATVACGTYTESTVLTLRIELNRAASTIRFAVNGTYFAALTGVDFTIAYGGAMYYHASTRKNIADSRSGVVDVGQVVLGWGEATT